MTEHCGEVLQVIRCDLPAGHGGNEHHAKLPLPADANRLIAGALDDLEAQAARYRKMVRWTRAMAVMWGLSLAVYIWLIVVGLT